MTLKVGAYKAHHLPNKERTMKGRKHYGRAIVYSQEYYNWRNAVLSGRDPTHAHEVWVRKHGVR